MSSDLPSHPYACVKLAKVLAKGGHNVTLASPEGGAYQRISTEMNNWSASGDRTSRGTVTITTIGRVSTKTHANVRPVIDPQTWSALLNGIRQPFPLAQKIETMFDEQQDLYQNILDIVSDYDLVYCIHSMAATVCDAVEASGTNVPCIIFSSLPYDTTLCLAGGKDGRAWRMPRSLVTIPHVATYSAPKISSLGLRNIFAILCQLLWMALDTFLVNRAFQEAAKRTNARRVKRGLRPVDSGFRNYMQTYPVLTFGGTEPFMSKGEVIPDNVTAIGSLGVAREVVDREVAIASTSKSFQEWFKVDGRVVYAGFGTGTKLSPAEIYNVAKLCFSLPPGHRVLLALRSEEQRRLRPMIDGSIGSSPTSEGKDFLEYGNGTLRIESSVPQAEILESGKVDLFISHMGFGGFSEGVRAGVPFIAYPSGCDQWNNAKRAVETGITLEPGKNMDRLDEAVSEVLCNDEIHERARHLANDTINDDASKVVLEMIENITCVLPETTKKRSSSLLRVNATGSRRGRSLTVVTGTCRSLRRHRIAFRNS